MGHFFLLDPDPDSDSGFGCTDLIESGSNQDPKYRPRISVLKSCSLSFSRKSFNEESRNKHEVISCFDMTHLVRLILFATFQTSISRTTWKRFRILQNLLNPDPRVNGTWMQKCAPRKENTHYIPWTKEL
jgi:hypothetical protein